KPVKLMQNPQGVARIENGFFNKTVDWADGRFFLSATRLPGNDESKEKLMLAYGKRGAGQRGGAAAPGGRRRRSVRSLPRRPSPSPRCARHDPPAPAAQPAPAAAGIRPAA